MASALKLDTVSSKRPRIVTRMRGGWVIELDIEKFFDNLDHCYLRDFLGHRIRDGV